MHGGAEKVLLNLVNNMDHEKFDITVQTLFDVGVNKQFLSDKVHYKTCYKKNVSVEIQNILKCFHQKSYNRKYIKDDYDILVAYLEGSCTRIISGCPDKNKVKNYMASFCRENEKEFYKHIVLWMKQKKSIRDLIK